MTPTRESVRSHLGADLHAHTHAILSPDECEVAFRSMGHDDLAHMPLVEIDDLVKDLLAELQRRGFRFTLQPAWGTS